LPASERRNTESGADPQQSAPGENHRMGETS